jgi:hypothetical protein
MSGPNDATPSRSQPPSPMTAAVCGLFCPACSLYIGTREDPGRLDRLAARFGVSRDEVLCDGCRSERRLSYCAGCHMFRCAAERGYTFCGECPDCPCPDLREFVSERPHRADVYRNLARIAEIGGEAWMAEATERHSCPACGTINSAYDLVCRDCGRDPSSLYVEEHRDIIVARMIEDGLMAQPSTEAEG